MLNASCQNTVALQQQQAGAGERGDDADDRNSVTAATAVQSTPPVAAAAQLQDAAADKSMRLQACWIRLWDRWACEQRNLVLYQMHINHALSRERSKLALAGGRVVSCSKRVKQQQHHHPHTHHHHHHQHQQHQQQHHQNELHPAICCRSSHNPSDTPAASSSTCGLHNPPPPSTAAVSEDCAAGARDLRVLSAAVERLRASGWYYEGPDAQGRAAAALSAMPAGRFCVRDSRHSEHLFTMDVQTGRGVVDGALQPRPLSVRFTYADGAFGLDSAAGAAAATGDAALRVPTFRCPIELIDYYVRLSRIGAARQMVVHPVWTDQCGRFFSLMNLRRPMVKTDPAGFPSLKHMARLVINRHKRLITITPTSLPNELIEYLLQYPYSL